jgi:glutamate dehydrogenase/leucine dehydrogenase
VATAWLGTYPTTALVTGAGSVTEALVLQLRENGVGVSTPADVSGEVEMAFLGAGGGELTHTNLASYPAQTILGYQPNSVTARGLAEAKRGGVAVLPEFVAASGPLVAYEAARSTEEHLAVAASRVAAFVEQIDRSAAAGPYLEACFLAEAFIRSWSSDLPFGRPLA